MSYFFDVERAPETLIDTRPGDHFHAGEDKPSVKAQSTGLYCQIEKADLYQGIAG